MSSESNAGSAFPVVRRAVLAWVMLLKTAAIAAGLYVIVTGSLDGNALTFLLAVVGMLEGVVLYWFRQTAGTPNQ